MEAEHPGPALKLKIRKSGFLYGYVADKIGVLPSYLSEMLNGKKPLTPRVCLALEAEFGIAAVHLYHKQADYDLEIARQAFIVEQARNRFGVKQ